MINKMSLPSKKTSFCLLLLLALTLIPQFACSFFESKEDYKKEIELKGIEYSRQSFITEIKAGNREITKLFIKAGIDVNYKDKDGTTALKLLSENGDIELVQLLIESEADLNAETNSGVTALMGASMHGQVEVVKLLINSGADTNAKTSSGVTALMIASMHGQVEAVKLLINNGADINAKTNTGETALIYAARTSSFEVGKQLLKHGADVNAKDVLGNTVLSSLRQVGARKRLIDKKMSVPKNKYEFMEFLINAGAQDNYSVKLSEDVKKQWDSVILNIVDSKLKQDQNVKIKIGNDYFMNESDLKIKVVNFVPDYKKYGDIITTKSSKPNNPAVEIWVYHHNKAIFGGWFYGNRGNNFNNDRFYIYLEEGVRSNL